MSRTKDFRVVRAGNGNMFAVQLEGGGEVPRKLSGLFTSEMIANEHITQFLYEEEKAEEAKAASAAAKKTATSK